VPFYYIEYGIAQLGALQVWKNYKQDAQKGLAQYLKGLSVGYTMPIPDVYATAGVSFDFSEAMMRDLFNFVEQEYNQLIR
jgi:oligoendopeptidase F